MSSPIGGLGAYNPHQAYATGASAPTTGSSAAQGTAPTTGPSTGNGNTAATQASSAAAIATAIQQATAASAPSASALGGTAATATSSVQGSDQSLAGTDTFLKLLVAQLKNQDPTSPMDDSAFVTQLAQFNSVEQMIGLKNAVTQEASQVQDSEGIALIGKQVAYTSKDATGNVTINQGLVTGIGITTDGVQLQIVTSSIPLKSVTAVTTR